MAVSYAEVFWVDVTATWSVTVAPSYELQVIADTRLLISSFNNAKYMSSFLLQKWI